MMMPQPGFMMPPPRGRGVGFAIFMTLIVVVLAVSILLNFMLLFSAGLKGGRDTQQETVIENGDPTNRIAVVSLDGVIMEQAAERFHKLLKSVEDDSTIRALVVEIDSPGGSVTASDEIYHDLLRFKSRPGKTMPVVIAQKSLAASGGYYVSCAGDFIVAEPTTLTGNIGVLFERFNVSRMFDKWGIEETTIKSTHSPFKNAESMFKPETPEANAYLQTIVDDAYGQFSGVVKAGRATATNPLKGKVEDVANGKIYTADQAFKAGLIDLIDYPDKAYAVAATRAGLTGSKPTVVRIKEMPGLLQDLLGAKSGIGTSGGESISTGGNHIEYNGVKIDASTLNDLLRPQLMYLWDGR